MKKKFDVSGMTCSSCVAHVEKAVSKLDGVKDVEVSLMTNSMNVVYDENAVSPDDIATAVSGAGYNAKINESGKALKSPKDISADESRKLKRRLILSVVFLIPLFTISMGHMVGVDIFGENYTGFSLTQLLLTIPIIVINFKYFTVGFKSLFKGSPNMDTLIAVGSAAAFLYGVFNTIKIITAADTHAAHGYAMDLYFVLVGCVILICILLNRFLDKLAIPSLLFFILLGMLLGENGILGVVFNDYQIAEMICSTSLIFIMFFGGFGTNLKVAKPVIVKSIVLSTLGVLLTALLVAGFVYYVLDLSWLQSLLIGSVISSTDATSVFNILRSRHLSLKYGTDSLLEIESGSNDPVSYMLTISVIMIMTGQNISLPVMIFQQIIFGLLCGFCIGKIIVKILNEVHVNESYENTVIIFASSIITYAFSNLIGGNGYLSVYICGIILGNSYIPHKKDMVHFYETLTKMAQVLIFFLLGLLVTPSELPEVIIPAILIMIFLTFVARPLSISVLLGMFRSPLRQMAVVSWAGLRGVASIVFAIYAVLYQVDLPFDLFNLVFCIVLFSLSIQGSLLPWISKKCHMINPQVDILRTFNDYQEDNDMCFVKMKIGHHHHFKNLKLKDINADDLLVILIARDHQTLIPNGDTEILEGDLLVLAAKQFENRENIRLDETHIHSSHKWKDKLVKDISLPAKQLIIMIQRNHQSIIPNGTTPILENDILVTIETQDEI